MNTRSNEVNLVDSEGVEFQPSTASFRDPSGIVFYRSGKIFRQINQVYAQTYTKLLDSGFYRKLVDQGMLVAHQEVDQAPLNPSLSYKVIQPEYIPFISHPFEWCFSQLKDAAILTLKIQRVAIKNGMSLKDASSYNIQFLKGKPILIDTLSFETYQEGRPWIAYRQFCQHFLAPLSLMAHCDFRLGQLLRIYIDGVPLNLASQILPLSTYFNIPILLHIHLHARSQQKYGDKKITSIKQFNRNSMLGLIDSLLSGIENLNWKFTSLGWENYEQEHSYSQNAIHHKIDIVNRWLELVRPKMVWDMGANKGLYSRLASNRNIFTISMDFDPSVVESNYLESKNSNETNILPLVMDFNNPSPAIGWQNSERMSLLQRGPADLVLSLAFIHHLAIANNVPLEKIALFFHQIAKWAIIEFIPKEDNQVQRLLANREDIFPNYSFDGFVNAFSPLFYIHHVETISDSLRKMCLMERRNP
jgi:hypothetical protein